MGEHREARDAATVGDLCDKFLTEYLPTRRPVTARDYRLQISKYVRPLLGRHKVEALSYADVGRLHRKISEQSPISANRVLGLLSRMMTLATRWGMRVGANPCKGIERNPEHKRRRYLSSAELARLSAALEAHANRDAVDAIRLLLLTGARKGELLAARWADIDILAGRWTKPGATTKQKTEHIVPLSAPALQILSRRKRTSDFVFPGYKGAHRRDLSTTWRTVLDAAQIDNLHIHDLRHSYASHLASSGVGLHVIGALLGHTQPQTTHRYAHLFDDPLRAATEKVGAIISGQPVANVIPIKGGR